MHEQLARFTVEQGVVFIGRVHENPGVPHRETSPRRRGGHSQHRSAPPPATTNRQSTTSLTQQVLLLDCGNRHERPKLDLKSGFAGSSPLDAVPAIPTPIRRCDDWSDRLGPNRESQRWVCVPR